MFDQLVDYQKVIISVTVTKLTADN